MDQSGKDSLEQVEYLGKWLPKKYFRAWVYGVDSKKLANSWDEFTALMKSGLWFATQEEADGRLVATKPVPIRTGRKSKNDSDS